MQENIRKCRKPLENVRKFYKYVSKCRKTLENAGKC
jgi:hypothetical protein